MTNRSSSGQAAVIFARYPFAAKGKGVLLAEDIRPAIQGQQYRHSVCSS